MPSPTIQLDRLSRLELAELKRLVPPGSLAQTSEARLPPDAFGDLGSTVAALFITAEVVRALAAFFVTSNRGRRGSEEFEISLPDGTKVRRKVRWHDSTDEPLEASIYKQIVSIPEIKAIVDQIGTIQPARAEEPEAQKSDDSPG